MRFKKAYSLSLSIVIPVYNKTPEQVNRAVKSALNQTYKPEQIIVVDDHSDTPVELDIDSDIIRLIRHERNMGVAHARNTGVRALNTKYVCCLDADDAIAPDFLTACIEPMEKDRSIGVSYTRLRWETPDGNTGISAWPDEWDYQKFLKKQNQVPTC